MHFIYCNVCGKIIGFAKFAEGFEPEQEYYLCPDCIARVMGEVATAVGKEE